MLPKGLPPHRLLPRPLLLPELAHTTVGWRKGISGSGRRRGMRGVWCVCVRAKA